MASYPSSGTECVASYSPARIALLGSVRIVIGLLVAAVAVLTLWETSAGNVKPGEASILPHWWMYAVCAALIAGALCLITGGVGRIVSSFADDCYFCAGLEGIAVRLPRQGWFGRFRLTEYRIHWDEIRQLVCTTHRVNMIPVGRELRIVRNEGKPITIERHFFTTDVREIQGKLMTIRASMKS